MDCKDAKTVAAAKAGGFALTELLES